MYSRTAIIDAYDADNEKLYEVMKHIRAAIDLAEVMDLNKRWIAPEDQQIIQQMIDIHDALRCLGEFDESAWEDIQDCQVRANDAFDAEFKDTI